MRRGHILGAALAACLTVAIGTPFLFKVQTGSYSGVFTQSVISKGGALCFGTPAFSVENIKVSENGDGISLGDLEARLLERSTLTYQTVEYLRPTSGGRSRLKLQVKPSSEGIHVAYSEKVRLGRSGSCTFKTTGVITPSQA
jgi:hypothetical protein